jgi:hypothetical protein
MKKITVVVMLIGLSLFLLSVLTIAQEKAAPAQEKAAPAKVVHKYVGAAKCKMCHNSPTKGEQFKKWSDSKHAKAYETLASQEAIEVGKKLGVDAPQKSDKCLVCHVTGYAAPAEAKDAAFSQTEGVGCEVCHGPGSDYKDMKIMKDSKAAVAAGLMVPDEATCKGCHNQKSPTFKTFVFADAYKIIAHPIPKATDTGTAK